MRSSSIILFLIFGAFALLPHSMQAQTGQEVVLFRGTRDPAVFTTTRSGELLIVSLEDASVQTIPLPAQLFPLTVGDTALSPDHRYLAFTSGTLADVASPVEIVDLQSNSCCVTVPPPLGDVAAYELGGFSPDSARLALSWVGFSDRNANYITGGMMTVDAATASPIQSISMQDVNAAYSTQQSIEPPWTLVGDWRDDGIRFRPHCYACDALAAGYWSIWSPESNAIVTDTTEYFNNLFGDVLLSTGEILLARQDERFPVAEIDSLFPVPNIISYVQQVTSSTRLDSTVIYFDENLADLRGYAHWVLDGQAALVTPYESDEWTLLYRDGTQQSVSVSPESRLRFLAGTPNGWLARIDDPEWNTLLLYTVEGAEVLSTSLPLILSDDDYVTVLDAPELGASITTTGGFPTVEPAGGVLAGESTVPMSEAGTCPNLLAVRISRNSIAQVTSGASNRLRSEPSIDGSVLGQIPGGAQISVLDGPVCDDVNAIVWWQVDYNGQVGWTAESLEDTYFVEPVGGG